ncbi:MAG TPA: ABC transporter permease [Vicinamibacterales bacterium]|nr:ABC transporter permease [Vicinamibacterales bacterium]
MFRQDVRYAFRSLVKNPLFTAIAVACLSLGIGVNATIFSVVDGVMLQPYPYADAGRIVVLNSTNQRERVQRGGISYADFKDLRDGATTLEQVGAFQMRSLTISDGSGEPERYSGVIVSWTLFHVLGVQPVIGRNFEERDDHPGADPVVVLSDHVWVQRYQRDPSVVGRSILINGRAHTVIGVMPPKFAFPENQRLWVPVAEYLEQTPRDARGLQVFARLKPNATQEQARAELEAIGARLAQAYPVENRDWSFAPRPLRTWMLPDQVELMLLSMMGAVTLVLLIACANVANLLLARASVRQREISIRAALGAGRLRIVRQLLTEAVFIGVLSAPLGIGVAWIGIKLLDSAMPTDGVPYFIQWSLDARALAYTIAISILTGIIFGTAPALQAVRSDLQSTLKDGGRGSAGGSKAFLRNALVVVEIALSLVLLIGASLFIRSFMNLQTTDVGFETTRLMTLRFYLPGAAYDADDAKARRVEDIVRRVEGLPNVDAAFASNMVPMGSGGGGARVLVEGRAVEAGQEPFVAFVGVTPRMRQTLDVPLLAGRDMTDAEGTTRTPVALINEQMARRLWPDADPVGRRFRMTSRDVPDWFTVIGVIADFRHRQGNNTDPQGPAVYVPYPFQASLNTGLTIRVSGPPASIVPAVREQIRMADPTLPLFEIRTAEELRQQSYWMWGLFGRMFGTFGLVALVLASIGVYGVLSYSVSQRVQEIGVRMALGAERRDVLSLIVGQGFRLAAVGVMFGLLGAWGVTRLIATLLYNVTPTDPASFGGVAVFLTLTAVLASYIPARRAMAVDPIVALRND